MTDIICPSCGESFGLREIAADRVRDETIEVYCELGVEALAIHRYVGCFRSAGPRARLAPDRRLRILKEIVRLLSLRRFVFSGQEYGDIPADLIIESIEEVSATGKRGFRDHNYLKRVMITRLQTRQRADADRQRIQTEREAEDRERRTMRTEERGPALGRPEDHPSADPEGRAAAREGLGRIQEIVGGVSGKLDASSSKPPKGERKHDRE